MTATNHALTGAVIAAAVPHPLICLPLALLSHVVLDAIPHFTDNKRIPLTSPEFKVLLASDALLATVLVLCLFALQPAHVWLIAISAFVATSPDLWWAPYWVWELRGNKRKLDPIGQFLDTIQWCTRPWGIVVELAWFSGGLVLLRRLLHL